MWARWETVWCALAAGESFAASLTRVRACTREMPASLVSSCTLPHSTRCGAAAAATITMTVPPRGTNAAITGRVIAGATLPGSYHDYKVAVLTSADNRATWWDKTHTRACVQRSASRAHQLPVLLCVHNCWPVGAPVAAYFLGWRRGAVTDPGNAQNVSGALPPSPDCVAGRHWQLHSSDSLLDCRPASSSKPIGRGPWTTTLQTPTTW